MRGFTRKHLAVRFLTALMVVVAGLASAAHAQGLPLGAKYRDHVVVAEHSVPLLYGEWTVVAVG